MNLNMRLAFQLSAAGVEENCNSAVRPKSPARKCQHGCLALKQAGATRATITTASLAAIAAQGSANITIGALLSNRTDGPGFANGLATPSRIRFYRPSTGASNARVIADQMGHVKLLMVTDCSASSAK